MTHLHQTRALVRSALPFLCALAVAPTALAAGSPNPPPMTHWWALNGSAADNVGGVNLSLELGATYAPGRDKNAKQALSLNELSNTRAHADATSIPGNFGAQDFAVSFWMQTTQNYLMAVAGKRPVCNDTNFWSIRMNLDVLGAEVSDGIGNYLFILGTRPVNDGAWHAITLKRTGTTVQLLVDGVVDASGATAAVANVSNDAPLLIGDEACVFLDPTLPFVGRIDDFKLFDFSGK